MIFQCTRCGSEFPTPVALKSHVITSHLNLDKDTKYLEWETLGLAGGGSGGRTKLSECQTDCQTSRAVQEQLPPHLSKKQVCSQTHFFCLFFHGEKNLARGVGAPIISSSSTLPEKLVGSVVALLVQGHCHSEIEINHVTDHTCKEGSSKEHFGE